MVAVAPLWFCAASSADAVSAAATVAPAASSPKTKVTAAGRPAPRPRADSAENAENTEYPFEQDPLSSGVAVPPAESVAPGAVFGILGTRPPPSSRGCGRKIDPTRNRYRQDLSPVWLIDKSTGGIRNTLVDKPHFG